MGFNDDLNGEGSLQDRDKAAFAPDGSGGVARKIISGSGNPVDKISYDEIVSTTPTDLTLVRTYKLATVTVATQTLTFPEAVHCGFPSIVWTTP